MPASILRVAYFVALTVALGACARSAKKPTVMPSSSAAPVGSNAPKPSSTDSPQSDTGYPSGDESPTPEPSPSSSSDSTTSTGGAGDVSSWDGQSYQGNGTWTVQPAN